MTSTLPSFTLRYLEAMTAQIRCFDSSGAAFDLTGAVVKMVIDRQGGGGHVVLTATITDEVGGLCEVAFTTAHYGTASDKLRPGRHDFAIWSDDTCLLVGFCDIDKVPNV